MPTYQLKADIVCHDVKYGDRIELTVERDVPPSRAEAEGLLWPRAADALGARGEAYDIEFQAVWVDGEPVR